MISLIGSCAPASVIALSEGKWGRLYFCVEDPKSAAPPDALGVD